MKRRACVAVLALLMTLGISAVPLAAQNVTNVRAQQLPDKTVEVLYDLAGASTEGAAVSMVVSGDGGVTYMTMPAASTLSGSVGGAIMSGTNRRIIWSAGATLPAGTFGTNYRVAVTATNPASGGQEVTVTLPGGVPLVMVRIPAGTFQMGSPGAESARDPGETLHQVTLTQDYYMGKYDVTQAQWQAVMGANPSLGCGDYGIGPSNPVYCVSWNNIAETGGFLEKLNQYLTSTVQQGAGKFRLPTEAEWERAARASTQTRFSFGDNLECGDACEPCSLAAQYMWWCANGANTTHAVGQKQPNGFGLYDMHGNVYQWVNDRYGAYTAAAQTNPTGPVAGSNRIVRGGNFGRNAQFCRSADRGDTVFLLGPGDRDGVRVHYLGFRLARSL